MGVLDNLDLKDRKTQLLVGGGVLVGVLALRGLRGGETVVEADLPDSYGTRSDAQGVIGWVGDADPTAPAPQGPATEPEPTIRPRTPAETATAITDEMRGRPTSTAAPAVSAPAAPIANAGALPAPGGMRGAGFTGVDGGATYAATPTTPAAAAVDAGASTPDVLKPKPGRKGRYQDGGRASTPAPASSMPKPKPTAPRPAAPKQTGAVKGRGLVAAAGEGIVDDCDCINPHAWGALAGTVGGFDPNPAAVAATVSAAAREGESLGDLSARLYGTRGHAARLLAMNPDLMTNPLQAGDALRVM